MSRLDCGARRVAGMLPAALAGFVLILAAPARAQADTAALCTVTLPSVSITPPFNPFVLNPATGTVATAGRTGTVSCLGKIDGARVTGPGRVGISYAYSNGTCVSHVGLGSAGWTIPTEAGTKRLTGTLSVRRIGLAILAEVRFASAQGVLTGGLVPIEGDCVASPLSKVRVVVAGPVVGT